jgi:methionyl-tRNA synthetase
MNSPTANKTLVTCALPYANGAIHLGHMVEHIQTDIYVRFLRSMGRTVIFLCADDTHGAPIELSAMKAGVTPEAFVAQWAIEHQQVFADFHISFDHYGSTNSAENKHYAELVYTRAKAAGFIARKEIEQPFDAKAGRWLSDRFIRGTCPNCHSPDQYGDACEKCNATYTPKELTDAKSAISGEPLTWKKSEHLFFQLSKDTDFLRSQIATPGFMNAGPAAQLQSFFEKGLADWDISRDGPYFGFAIPGEVNKFFYVWLDAPIGYIAATQQYMDKTGQNAGALEHWRPDSSTDIVHCIGKDIVYFHCLFWPAVLKVAGLKVPKQVHIHGHLTVNGEKMSKSRGTFINARQYLELLDPNYLRFHFAQMLGNGTEDIDFSLKEFQDRVEAGLVNNLGNLANRTLSLLTKPELGGRLSPPNADLGKPLIDEALSRLHDIVKSFEAFDSRSAMKEILGIGFLANQFLAKHEPWKKMKSDPEMARSILSEAAEVVYLVSTLLEPVVPHLAQSLCTQLNRPALGFAQLLKASYPLLNRTAPLGEAKPLIGRMDAAVVARLVTNTSAPAPASTERQAAKPTTTVDTVAAEIDYADFAKLNLRAGKIISARRVPKADKLLELTVDVGEQSPRTIVSGIALSYQPEQLAAVPVVVVVNLKPRTLKGIESRGMLLTAGTTDDALVLIHPGPHAPGTVIK